MKKNLKALVIGLLVIGSMSMVGCVSTEEAVEKGAEFFGHETEEKVEEETVEEEKVEEEKEETVEEEKVEEVHDGSGVKADGFEEPVVEEEVLPTCDSCGFSSTDVLSTGLCSGCQQAEDEANQEPVFYNCMNCGNVYEEGTGSIDGNHCSSDCYDVFNGNVQADGYEEPTYDDYSYDGSGVKADGFEN